MEREKLNRWKGLAMGIIGGLVGVVAMRYYLRQLAPTWFAEAPAAEPDTLDRLIERLPDVEPRAGRLYRDGESPEAAGGRLIYAQLSGKDPHYKETRKVIEEVTLLVWGVLMGIAYGYTRTTTRGRDIAGGFFYGIRLYVGWRYLLAWLGLAESPKKISRHQHFIGLSGMWVYSFITTNVTRILYRLF